MTAAAVARPLFDAELSLGGIAALLAPKRPVLPKDASLSFYVQHAGGVEIFTLFLGKDPMMRRGGDQRATLRVMTNPQTLTDLLLGAFDPNDPAPEHLFIYEGDQGLFDVMARALVEGQGWLSMQIAETTKKSRRSTRRRR